MALVALVPLKKNIKKLRKKSVTSKTSANGMTMYLSGWLIVPLSGRLGDSSFKTQNVSSDVYAMHEGPIHVYLSTCCRSEV